MARRPEPIGGSPLSGAGDAAVFLFFVALGCAYIVWAKLAALPAGAVTTVPVMVMLAYAAVVMFLRSLRLREDQSGDNLYYMGFLFTLTSLAVSLWQFQVDGAAEEIVRNFGIAIASTIAGIALRIFMNQMRRDPIEVERVSRLELADAARRVRRELDAVVVEMSHFRRSTRQVAEESWSGVQEQVEATAARLLAGVEEMTARSAAPLETASRASGESVEALTRTMVATLKDGAATLARETEEVARAAEIAVESAGQRMVGAIEDAAGKLSTETRVLGERTADLSAALAAITDRLSALSAPERVVELRLEPVMAPLTEAVDRFGAGLSDHVAGLSRVADALAAEARRREAEERRLDALDDKLEAVLALLLPDTLDRSRKVDEEALR